MLTRGEDTEVRDRRVSVTVEGFRNEDIYILEIRDVERTDAGTYKCETTDRNPDSKDIDITVGGGA